MKLVHPFLSYSDNRSMVAAYNPICGNPYSWFDTDYFRNESIYCISFNFLVDWRSHTLQKVAWIKRIITEDYSAETENIMNAIYRCDGKDYLRSALTFCRKNGFALQYVLIPDIACDDWLDQTNKLIIFDVSKFIKQAEEGCVQEYSSMDFVELIRNYKKDYHPIGKGKDKASTKYRLGLSETSLEVFLSQPHEEVHYEGDTGFPGDADVVLFDNSGTAKAVIELKKHDVGSVKSAPLISDESMSLYKFDSLKYDSLNVLSSVLGCPFHVLFFPITEEGSIKIESFIANGTHLYLCASNLYDLPKCNENPSLNCFSASFNKLNSQCIDMIASYSPNDHSGNCYCTAPSITPYTCPHCNAPVRLNRDGKYYCSDYCGMSLQKYYSQELSAEQCEALLQGNEVPFVNNFNRPIILLPNAASEGKQFNGKLYYRWDCR